MGLGRRRLAGAAADGGHWGLGNQCDGLGSLRAGEVATRAGQGPRGLRGVKQWDLRPGSGGRPLLRRSREQQAIGKLLWARSAAHQRESRRARGLSPSGTLVPMISGMIS